MTDLHLLLVNEAPDALLALTPTGTILSWNRTAETIFGYRSDEAVGQSWVSLVVPAGQEEQAAQALATAVHSEMFIREAIRKKKDGTILYVDISTKPVTDGEGVIQFIAASVKDVTHSKIQRDADMIAAKFGGLLESVPDAMILVNVTGRIVLANSNAIHLFGYSHSELIGEMVEVLLPERFRSGHSLYRSRYSHEPKTRSMGAALELFGRRKDGTEFPVEISLSPMATEHGMMVISAVRDISERRQQEEARSKGLQETNRLKSEFLTKMSHELRTPLNSVIGFTEFMLEERPGPLNAKQKEYLNDVLTSGKHLLNLINTILNLAKVEAGKIDLDPQEFDLKAAVQQVCSAFVPIALKKKVRLTTIMDDQPGYVVLDLHKFKQILYNLLSNAIKFTNENGTVNLHVQKTMDNTLEFSVQDSGIGIREEDLPKLFNEFQQLDSGSSRRYEGSGLGLVLTKKFVEMHGGSIQVQSELGVGSCVTVTIPIRPEARV